MSHPHGSKSAAENQTGRPAGCPSEEAKHWQRCRSRVRQMGGKLRAGHPARRSEQKARGRASQDHRFISSDASDITERRGVEGRKEEVLGVLRKPGF